jgi:hypothetical protein
VSLGHFTDFIIGQAGQKKVKDQLADLYVAVADGDWSRLFRSPAKLFLSYIDALFQFAKPVVFSLRVLIYSFIFSMLVDLVLFISSTNISPSLIVAPLRAEGIPPWDKLYLFVSIVNNSIFDILSIIIVRWLTKSAAGIPATYIVPLLVSSVGIALVIFLLASMSQNFMLVIVYSRFYGIFPNVYQDLEAAVRAAQGTLVFFFLPQGVSSNLHAMLPSIQVVIPITTYVLFCAAAYVFYLSRNFLRKPLLILLERLDESRSGIFTSLAAAISAVVGLLQALGKWMALGSTSH